MIRGPAPRVFRRGVGGVRGDLGRQALYFVPNVCVSARNGMVSGDMVHYCDGGAWCKKDHGKMRMGWEFSEEGFHPLVFSLFHFSVQYFSSNAAVGSNHQNRLRWWS